MTTPNLKELRQQYAQRHRRKPWWVRATGVLAVLVVMVIAAAYFVAPSIVRRQLEKRLTTAVHRPVTVQQVSINPLRLAVTVDGLKIADSSGGVFVGWRRLYVNFDAGSLLADEWRFDEVALDGLDARIAVGKDGRLNFADLLRSDPGVVPAPVATEAGRPLRVDRLSVSGASIDYSDASLSEAFTTRLGPVTFSLRQFHTGGANQAPGEFSARTEAGETLGWRGLLAVAPLRSSGEIALGGLNLKKYQTMIGDRVGFRVLDGTAELSARYELVVVQGQLALRVSDGVAKARGIKLAEHGGTVPVVSLDTVELTGGAADTDKRTVSISRLAVSGGAIEVRRDERGLNLATMFGGGGSSGATPGGASSPRFVGKLDELDVREVSVGFEDRVLREPLRQRLEGVALTARGVSSAPAASPVPVEFAARFATGGTVKVTGSVAPQPLKGALSIELSQAPLNGFSGYLENEVGVRILRGSASAAVKASFETDASGVPVVVARGNASVADFSAANAGSGEALAGWRELSVRGFEFTPGVPMKLTVEEVTWNEPAGSIALGKDGALSLPAASGGRGTAVAGGVSFPVRGSQPAKSAVSFVAIDRVVVANGRFVFTDESIEPRVSLVLDQVAGNVSGLSSASLARADVDVRGRLNAGGRIVVSGQANPLAAETFSDLKVELKGLDLAEFGPYVGKYAGYQLERGSLSLESRVRLLKQRLDMDNQVALDVFTLGAATNSADATSLPVPLALALLRDVRGKIAIPLAVQGNLDDPSFRVGAVIGRILTNLVVKAATAPFALIGSMFGGGGVKGDELAFQDFSAGSSALDEVATAKLEVMAKALRERPGLMLELKAGFREATDTVALRERELEQRIQTAFIEGKRRAAPPNQGATVTADNAVITPQGEARLLTMFYREAYAPEPALAAPVGDKPVSKRRWFIFRLFSRTTPEPVVAAPAVVAAPPPLPPVAVMRAQLLEAIPVDASELRMLAAARGRAVRDYLLAQGGVAPERVVMREDLEPGARVRLAIK